MTLKMLSKYYELRKRLMLYEDTLGALRAAAESITPALSDMPKSPTVQDKLSKFVVQIVDLEGQIAKLNAEIEIERQAVISYVDTIQNGHTKTVFSLRFIECMTWADIAKVIGDSATEDSVKKICYRYLNEQE